LRYPNPAPETSDLCRPERFQRTTAISRPGAAPERDLLVSEITRQRRQRTVRKVMGRLVPVVQQSPRRSTRILLPAIQRSGLAGVAGAEKEAKLPAIEVTAKIAHISRATSTILPPAVGGLAIADDMVSS